LRLSERWSRGECGRGCCAERLDYCAP
jgi:hypothetical protein